MSITSLKTFLRLEWFKKMLWERLKMSRITTIVQTTMLVFVFFVFAYLQHLVETTSIHGATVFHKTVTCELNRN